MGCAKHIEPEDPLPRLRPRVYKLFFCDSQIGVDFETCPKLPTEVTQRAERNEHVAWQPSVDEGCDELIG